MTAPSADLPRPLPRGPFTLALALLAWSGVLLQLALSLARGPSVAQGLVAYLGYFTVLTNLLVASALSAVLLRRPAWLARPQVLACAAASIALVGIAYHLLLRHVWDPQGAQWGADMLLHYATPWLYVLWWVLRAPMPVLRWWVPFAWALYPAGYLLYALLRGAWLGSYPYPFIDVAQLGYGGTLVNALGLLLAFLVVAWALVGVKRLMEKRA
jgi:hypothetical protein